MVTWRNDPVAISIFWLCRATTLVPPKYLSMPATTPGVEYPTSLQRAFSHSQKGTDVDLHWGIPPILPRFSRRSLWSHATHIELIGTSVPTFDRSSAMAVAAINAVKAYWNVSLRQHMDVAVSLRRLSVEEWHSPTEAIEAYRMFQLRVGGRLCQRLTVPNCSSIPHQIGCSPQFGCCTHRERDHPAPVRSLTQCATHARVCH